MATAPEMADADTVSTARHLLNLWSAESVESILSTEEQVHVVARAADARRALNRSLVEYCRSVNNPDLLKFATADMLRIERELAAQYVPMMETAAGIRALIQKSSLKRKAKAIGLIGQYISRLAQILESWRDSREEIEILMAALVNQKDPSTVEAGSKADIDRYFASLRS